MFCPLSLFSNYYLHDKNQWNYVCLHHFIITVWCKYICSEKGLDITFFSNKRFFSKKGPYILLQIYFFSLQHLPRNTKILKILIVWSRVNPHSKSCLNIKELLAQNRRNIWSLSDCNGTQTHNHLVCKRTLYYLVKLTNG